MGTAFGFLVSTSSVMAALKKDVSGIFVYPQVIVCFCGISAILACFITQKRRYVQQMNDLPRLYQMSQEEQLKEAERVIHASEPIVRLEMMALILLGIAMILFLTLAVVCFKSP